MRGAATNDKRVEDRAERQARIEKAAEDVFAHRGVAAATMDDIARHSGVSKGALYLHFESKEQLYLTLAVRALKELTGKLEANPTEGTGFQRTRALIQTYANYSLSDPARFCLAGAWVAPDWQLPESELRVLALRAKLLESPEQAPPQVDPQLWAGLVPQQNGSTAPTIDRERIVTSYVELLLAAIERK